MNQPIHQVNPITDVEIAEALAGVEADAHEEQLATWRAEHTQTEREQLHERLGALRREREAVRELLRGTERHLLSIERGEVVALTAGVVEETRESVQAQRALIADLERGIQELGARLDETCDAPREVRLHWRLSDRVGGVRLLTRACAGGSYETCARREDGRLMGLWRWAHKGAAERGHAETLRRVWHTLLTGGALD